MRLPLSILNRIAKEAEDNGLHRSESNAANDAAKDNPVEIRRIDQEDRMTDETEYNACEGHIAFAELLQQTRAEDCHDKDCDECLHEIEAAVDRIIGKDVLAVIRENRARDGEDDVLHHPDRHARPEVRVDSEALQSLADGNLCDLFARFDDNRLFAA